MRYKEFEVYKRAYRLSLEVHKSSLTFPKYEQYALADQLRRASKSIALNIAEGYGKSGSAAEFKRYLLISLGSCNETLVILDYCKDLGYMSPTDCELYHNEYNVLSKMVYSLHKSWRDLR